MLDYLRDDHPAARWLEVRNLARQYDFMTSSFALWQLQNQPALTNQFVAELNFYAAHNLSPFPGQLRSNVGQNVRITNTEHQPPDHTQVGQLMVDFIQRVARFNKEAPPSYVAAYALWRLNWIHPFVQGNGRTSRAVCFFILCQRYNMWLPGAPLLPELIKANRDEYCSLLMDADRRCATADVPELSEIQAFLERLVAIQISSAGLGTS